METEHRSDDTRPVLVTGANGHLGYNVVRALLARGYSVRAGVRDPHDMTKVAPLIAAGALPVAAELLAPSALARAADGVQGVFHAAAVVQMWANDPDVEIIRPIVDGTRNVLEAAHRAGVKRVVLTSSIAAVGVDSNRTGRAGPRPMSAVDRWPPSVRA